jgi:probable rRNA maturation factor
VSDAGMRRLNLRYRGINKTTDVLSFPMTDNDFAAPAALLGDIVISVPKALSQSKNYRVSFYDELLKLMIHGLLHLVGFDHEKNSYQKRKMKKKEKEFLNALKTMA